MLAFLHKSHRQGVGLLALKPKERARVLALLGHPPLGPAGAYSYGRVNAGPISGLFEKARSQGSVYLPGAWRGWQSTERA